MSNYPHPCMYVCMYVRIYVSIYPSIRLSIHLPIYLSIIYLSISLTISLTYQSERSTVEFRHRNSAVDMPPSLEKGQGCPHTGPLRSAPAPIHGKKTLASLVNGALSQCYTDVGWKVFLQLSVRVRLTWVQIPARPLGSQNQVSVPESGVPYLPGGVISGVWGGLYKIMMLVKDLAPSWHITEGLLTHHSRSAVGKTAEHCPHPRVLPKLPWEDPPISVSRRLDEAQWSVHREGQRK